MKEGRPGGCSLGKGDGFAHGTNLALRLTIMKSRHVGDSETKPRSGKLQPSDLVLGGRPSLGRTRPGLVRIDGQLVKKERHIV